MHPALIELDELVEERRLRKQFTERAPLGSVLGAAGTLVAGLVSHGPLSSGVAGVATAVGATTLGIAAERSKLESAIRRHPYYLLYGTEDLLANR